jgi:hypothetical protein
LKLTGKLLTKLEQSMRIHLTPEQRLIMLYRWGYEPRGECWDKDDFVYGINAVQKEYPDHRPKPNPLPDFLREKPDTDPFY